MAEGPAQTPGRQITRSGRRRRARDVGRRPVGVAGPRQPFSRGGVVWLNRDPLGEKGGANVYAFVGNAPVGRIDAEGRATWIPYPPPGHWVDDPVSSDQPSGGWSPTTYQWSPGSCGKDFYSAFIQVGLGGSILKPSPFVDDGTHGFLSDSSNYAPLYPNGGGGATVSAPGDGNAFVDQASTVWGQSTIGLNGQKFEVCRVCLKTCSGVCSNRTSSRQYDGYAIDHIGPCRTYTLDGRGGSVELSTMPGSDAPSQAFTDVLKRSYPKALQGGCIDK